MISGICKVDNIDYALNCFDHLLIYCSLNNEGGTMVTKVNECDKFSPQKWHLAMNWDRSEKDLFRQRVEMLFNTVYQPFGSVITKYLVYVILMNILNKLMLCVKKFLIFYQKQNMFVNTLFISGIRS